MSINFLVRTGFAAAAIILSSCALDPQGGYRPVTQISGSQEPPVSFEEAHAQCRTVSMSVAGYGATVPQVEAYRTCMARNGWQDQRALF